MTEVRLLRLIKDGLLPPKGVIGWRATCIVVLPNPWPREVVPFTDFLECDFGIPASDFLWGFLQEHNVQM